MIEDYSNTPSYFNNCEYFNKYLGQTSYYKGLQDALVTCIRRMKPKRVIELGCALGTTTFMLADMFPDIEFGGLDMRRDVVSKANQMQERRDRAGRDNASFISSDMMEFVRSDEIGGYDFVYMLYSFHHITDPQENKVKFLHDLYWNMAPKACLWIGETFLPENGMTVDELWRIRAIEGHTSTFWNCLKKEPEMPREKAMEMAGVSHDEELMAGALVDKRDNEYLIERSWAATAVRDAGFEICLNDAVNAIGDGVILAEKDVNR